MSWYAVVSEFEVGGLRDEIDETIIVVTMPPGVADKQVVSLECRHVPSLPFLFAAMLLL